MVASPVEKQCRSHPGVYLGNQCRIHYLTEMRGMLSHPRTGVFFTKRPRIVQMHTTTAPTTDGRPSRPDHGNGATRNLMSLRRGVVLLLLWVYVLFILDLAWLQFPSHYPAPNVVPLRSIIDDVKTGGRGWIVNFLGNIVAFIPIGMIPTLAGPGRLRPACGPVQPVPQRDDRGGTVRERAPRRRRQRPHPQYRGGRPGLLHLAAIVLSTLPVGRRRKTKARRGCIALPRRAVMTSHGDESGGR